MPDQKKGKVVWELIMDEFKNFTKNIVITGTIAGISKTVFAPFDRIKLILQSQDNNLLIVKGRRKRYDGILDLVKRVPKEQGFSSFWRGNMTNVIRYIPVQAFNFAYYDLYKKLVKNHLMLPKTEAAKTMELFIAGALAAISSFTLTYPLEFCQTRLATDVGSDCCYKDNGNMNNKKGPMVRREFTSLSNCVLKITALSGPKGLYKGFPIALCGATLYRSTYFALFDSCKKIYARYIRRHDPMHSSKMSIPVTFVVAHFVTATAGFIAYPLDTVGRRLMMESGRRKEDRKYKGALHCMRTIAKTEGYTAFYKGGLSNVVRSYGGALVLVLYEEVKHQTDWLKKEDDKASDDK